MRFIRYASLIVLGCGLGLTALASGDTHEILPAGFQGDVIEGSLSKHLKPVGFTINVPQQTSFNDFKKKLVFLLTRLANTPGRSTGFHDAIKIDLLGTGNYQVDLNAMNELVSRYRSINTAVWQSMPVEFSYRSALPEEASVVLPLMSLGRNIKVTMSGHFNHYAAFLSKAAQISTGSLAQLDLSQATAVTAKAVTQYGLMAKASGSPILGLSVDSDNVDAATKVVANMPGLQKLRLAFDRDLLVSQINDMDNAVQKATRLFGLYLSVDLGAPKDLQSAITKLASDNAANQGIAALGLEGVSNVSDDAIRGLNDVLQNNNFLRYLSIRCSTALGANAALQQSIFSLLQGGGLHVMRAAYAAVPESASTAWLGALNSMPGNGFGQVSLSLTGDPLSDNVLLLAEKAMLYGRLFELNVSDSPERRKLASGLGLSVTLVGAYDNNPGVTMALDSSSITKIVSRNIYSLNSIAYVLKALHLSMKDYVALKTKLAKKATENLKALSLLGEDTALRSPSIQYDVLGENTLMYALLDALKASGYYTTINLSADNPHVLRAGLQSLVSHSDQLQLNGIEILSTQNKFQWNDQDLNLLMSVLNHHSKPLNLFIDVGHASSSTGQFQRLLASLKIVQPKTLIQFIDGPLQAQQYIAAMQGQHLDEFGFVLPQAIAQADALNVLNAMGAANIQAHHVTTNDVYTGDLGSAAKALYQWVMNMGASDLTIVGGMNAMQLSQAVLKIAQNDGVSFLVHSVQLSQTESTLDDHYSYRNLTSRAKSALMSIPLIQEALDPEELAAKLKAGETVSLTPSGRAFILAI